MTRPAVAPTLVPSRLLGIAVRQACACCGKVYSRPLTADERSALARAAKGART